MEDLTGRQFGPYQIVAPLGEGGMAAVYKAYQPAMERYVALKVLPRQLAGDAQFVTRFQREAKLLAQLQHPHILPVFDFGEADGYTYLVMPFISSGTLTDQLRGQPFPWPHLRQIVTQIGEALDYAHARGLVHRDVKPSNVLLDERGNCLLTDFGLARMVEASVNLTTTGTIMGTPAYMSPEQGSGLPIDGRSDLYALGVILYELATGRVPYKAETPIAVIFKHIQDPLPPARSLNPELPESLERVILKALAKSPVDRYQTADEMVRAVRAALPEAISASPAVEPLSVTSTLPTGTARPGQPAVAGPTSLPTANTDSAAQDRKRRITPIWIRMAGAGLGFIILIGLGLVIGRGAFGSARSSPTHRPALGATASLQAIVLTQTRVPNTRMPGTTRVPPSPTRAIPTTRAPATPTRTHQSFIVTPPVIVTEVANWAVDFSYYFAPDFWSVGIHQYTLVADCPVFPDDSRSWTRSFEVSESAAVRSGEVYLRLSGLRHQGVTVSVIHPSQSTLAQWSMIEVTKLEAEQVQAVCTVTVSWDAGPAQALTVGGPYQP